MVPGSFAPLHFGGEEFVALASGALFWPARGALLVADLHLEQGSFFATHGQMLPPYDSLATLRALAQAIAVTRARAIWCLGDNFHDNGGEARLNGEAARQLAILCRQNDWTWIIGNHDRDVTGRHGGRVVTHARLGPIMLAHSAVDGDGTPLISGHFHPRMAIRIRGRRVVRRCFIRSAHHLILPAFGALTAGLEPTHPAIMAALGPGAASALVPVGGRLLDFPLDGTNG